MIWALLSFIFLIPDWTFRIIYNLLIKYRFLELPDLFRKWNNESLERWNIGFYMDICHSDLIVATAAIGFWMFGI